MNSRIETLVNKYGNTTASDKIDLREIKIFLEIGYLRMSEHPALTELLARIELPMLSFVFSNSISSYWPLLGIQWLADKNKPINFAIAEMIRNTLTLPWATQQYRHSALKLINKKC